MEIFDEFIVVDEKAINGFSGPNCGNCNCSFHDVTQFAALKFMTSYYGGLKIKDIGNASSNPPNSEPLAQIVRWIWEEKGHNRSMNPFPAPSNSSPDDDLTVKIGDKQIAVSAHWLSSVSPVISRMLSVEMKEKQQRMITLDELGVDMDQFMEFLEAISYLTMSRPFLPNPKNVLMLLKLADYFQVTALKSRCETHLINCVEIPLIDRFLLIEHFGLDNFKNYFSDLNIDKLRAFFNANHKQFFPVISKEFLYALSVRAMAGL